MKKWRDEGLIEIKMSRTAHEEASHVREREHNFDAFVKKFPKNRAVLTSQYLYTYTLKEDLTEDEKNMLMEINRIIKPDSEGIINDTYVIFDAHKDNAILVTRDGGAKSQPGGILGNRDRLKTLGIRILTVSQAVEFINQRLI